MKINIKYSTDAEAESIVKELISSNIMDAEINIYNKVDQKFIDKLIKNGNTVTNHA